ncbi:zf-HC2 domain-containing protein [Microbacterium suaedae]|uniref:zf-HC2 domain-containing protein n=1 Tax=Microbacterium suaedae TaxID=2067813 RepID=UPI000DA14050|nr:zf-HC2 domain-containing protein [Microbacterium suaedae]
MSHQELAEWDAAYVLGALSPADRARFEEHLEECGPCRASLTELAPLPGLLSRVPRERAEGLAAVGADPAGAAGSDTNPTDPDHAHASVAGPSDTDAGENLRTAQGAHDTSANPVSMDEVRGRPTGAHARSLGAVRKVNPLEPAVPGNDADARARIVDFASARHRRRRVVGAVVGAAAVVALTAAIAIPLLVSGGSPEDPPGDTLALEAVVDVPVSASVALTDVPWGTRVDMTCRYEQMPGAPADGWGYALVVVAADGTESELSTWRAYAGSTAELSAGTELSPDEIASIEVRSIANDAVLLQGDPADAIGE